LIDNDYQKNSWNTYKYEVKNAPILLSLNWIYTKYSEKDVTENMSAEIEYLRITGLEYAP
jgi:hypothetical protein